MPDTSQITDLIREFHCFYCGETIGVRTRNTLVINGHAIPFDKKHNIKCGACGLFTIFWVWKSVDKAEEKA